MAVVFAVVAVATLVFAVVLPELQVYSLLVLAAFAADLAHALVGIVLIPMLLLLLGCLLLLHVAGALLLLWTALIC